MQNTHTHTHTRHQKAYEQRHEERDCVSKIHFRFNVFVCCLLIFVRNAQSIIKCQEITLTGIIYLSTQPHTIEMKYDDVDAHELQLTVQKKNCLPLPIFIVAQHVNIGDFGYENKLLFVCQLVGPFNHRAEMSTDFQYVQ